jgi:hypothetical protein
MNDEILNRFIDGDLSAAERDEVLRAVNSSPEWKKKYESLKKAHELLTSMKPEEVSENFASLVMTKLGSQKLRARQQKRFLTIIISFFGIIILSITGFVFYNILSSVSQATETSSSITSLSSYLKDLTNLLFSKNGTTIIGSALSLIMLVSGYFLFEYQKKMKSNLGR